MTKERYKRKLYGILFRVSEDEFMVDMGAQKQADRHGSECLHPDAQ